ncbi:MAG: hypothetical protein ACI30V_10505, partial [Muribaculaceae bacterium]
RSLSPGDSLRIKIYRSIVIKKHMHLCNKGRVASQKQHSQRIRCFVNAKIMKNTRENKYKGVVLGFNRC